MQVIAHYGDGRQRVIPCATQGEALARIRAALAYDRNAKFTVDTRPAKAQSPIAATERVWMLV